MDTPVLFKDGYPARHVKDEARIDIDYASRIFQITEVHDCSIAKIRMAAAAHRLTDLVMAYDREIVLADTLLEIENDIDEMFGCRGCTIIMRSFSSLYRAAKQ